MVTRLLVAAVVAIAAAACEGGVPPDPAGAVDPLPPRRVTEAVSHDPDDPAIWLHATDPSMSLIVGTNKVAAPDGALVVFGLDGRIRQTIAGLDRPNNVDIEQAVLAGGQPIDVAIVTERLQHRLRVFRIDPDTGWLVEIGVVPVLDGQAGESAEPMGIGLYKRPSDGRLFAIVAPKIGGPHDYLWQYELDFSRGGSVRGVLVRRFGAFSERGAEPGEPGEIEAVVVDDALGYVYYADERFAIRKWHANPAHPDAGRELAVIGRDGYAADREGLAIYARPDGTGYLVTTDQIERGTVFRIYRREGAPGAPHDHSEVVRVVRTTADETDGIEVVAAPLPGYPHGLLVAMNSGPRNFAFFAWEQLMLGK